MSNYKHLGENERFVIELMLNKGESQGKIADFLGYSKTSISREISRNSINGKYIATTAQSLYLLRRECPGYDKKFNKLSDEAIAFIVENLKTRSSPSSNKLFTKKESRA
jgi:IS30 family transposase